MSQQDVEIVRRDFERFVQTGELQFEGLDPEIEIHDHDIPDADVYRGHEGFVEWIRYWSEPWEEFGLEPERFVDAGDRIVVITRLWARGKGSGVRTERRDGWIFTVRDGKAVRIDYYSSQAEALEAAGLRNRGESR